MKATHPRPAVGDLLVVTASDGTGPVPCPVVAALGQYITVRHPDQGEHRLHLLDDLVAGRRNAWRMGELVLEVTP